MSTSKEGPFRGFAYHLREKALDGQPSCLEFCRRWTQFFVVGMYALDESAGTTTSETEKVQSHKGSLQLFELETSCQM